MKIALDGLPWWMILAFFALDVLVLLPIILFIVFRKKRSKSTKREGKDKLRVAFIHPDLGIGGAERLVVDAALGLQNEGHLVSMYTSHHDPTHCFSETRSRQRDCDNKTLSVEVYGDWLPRALFGKLHVVCVIVRNLYLSYKLCKADATEHFDVIFVDQVSISVPILKNFTTARILFYCHFPDQLLTQRRSLLKRLYRYPVDFLEEITTGAADKILVNSKFTGQTFSRTFTRLGHITPEVLYPAINFAQYTKPGEKEHDEAEEDELLFLSLNRYERKKNINLAIKAFAELKTMTPDIFPKLKLIIAGGYDSLVKENVEHHKELEDLAAELKIKPPQIEFLQSISDTTRNKLLHKALAVIYTPENEHFGIVPIECMYAGRPVIACNSGGPTESVKDGETGFLCDPTPRAFARAMASLLEDPTLAQTLGTRGHQHVKQTFSLEAFTASLEHTLYSMLA